MQIEKIILDPALYLVATPIGNIADITIRALQTLCSVDYVACEDSRVTNKLLSHYGLKASMMVYNDHSSDRDRQKIIEKIQNGKSVALVSDAGMPLISDPGYKLVREMRDAEIKITVCPGASSVLTGLIVSGLPTNNFLFAGFLAAKTVARSKQLQELKIINKTTIIFEAANRLTDTLADIRKVLGDRQVAVARELTKFYEEIKTGNVSEVIEYYHANPARGEIVLIIGPDQNADLISDLESLDRQLKLLLAQHSVKDAVEVMAGQSIFAKKEIYRRALLVLACH